MNARQAKDRIYARGKTEEEWLTLYTEVHLMPPEELNELGRDIELLEMTYISIKAKEERTRDGIMVGMP